MKTKWQSQGMNRIETHPDQIAQIDEVATFSAGGAIALIALILFQILMVLSFFGTAKSAVQEAAIGTLWMAGNVLLCTGIIVGRTRSYRVFRTPPKE